MHANLAAISFVCAALLALFIPIARVRCNVANLAIVAWLVGANIVHGINAIIWSGNVEPHVPVWCDIVTKLLVGAIVALPGAVLSMTRRLELVSSRRPISDDPKSQTARIMVEFLLCYIVPIMYMGLHFIVQDHRFDIVEDYGCSASIHPSTVGLTIMWLPPILLCFVSFILCGAAISHSFSMPASVFYLHLEQRSPITSSIFIRRTAIAIMTACVIFVVSLFSIFTTSGFIPWISWSAVHADFSSINIVQSSDEARSIELVWLGIPIVSLIYVALVLALGEETRDACKWIWGRMTKLPKWQPRPLVLLPLYSAQTRSDMESRSRLSTPQPKPTLDLKSGWDDMLETESKKTRIWTPSRKRTSLRTTSPAPTSLRTISPSPSRSTTPTRSLSATSPTVCGDDEAFIKSTMDYLGSPVARTLGICPPPVMVPSYPVAEPIISPPPVYVSPRKATDLDTTISPISIRISHDTPPSPRRVPTDVESVISSVFDASWPQPPLSPLKLADTASQYRAANSRSVSPGISFEMPAISPTHEHHARPFEGSSISSIAEIPAPHGKSKRAKSVRSLMRTFSAEKVHEARAPVIYMKVVNEVA